MVEKNFNQLLLLLLLKRNRSLLRSFGVVEL